MAGPLTFDLSNGTSLITVTLTEAIGGGVTVSLSATGNADIRGIAFDVVNNSLPTNITGTDVNTSLSSASANSITRVGNISFSGSPYDVGVLFNSGGGSSLIRTTTFTLTGISLAQLSSQRFTAQATGLSGSPSFFGTAPLITVPPTAVVSIAFQSNTPDLLENLTFDLTGDGRNDSIFQPELGGSFFKVITVTNTSTTSSITNARVSVDARSALFDTDFSTLTGNTAFTLLDDGDGNAETALIEIASIAAGATVELKVATQRAPTANIATRNLTFNTQAGSSPNDPGASFNELTLYLNKDDYSFNSNGEFRFGSFDKYEPTAQVITGNSSTATLLPLTVYGTSFTANDGVHNLFSISDHVFNSDTLYSVSGSRRSSLANFDLQLLWASDDPVPTSANAALAYIDGGTFDLANSTPTFKGFSAFFNVDGPQGFNQTALAGNFTDSDLVEVTFSGGNFQNFVNGLDATKQYRILVSGTTTLNWSNYNASYVSEVVFLSASGGTATVSNSNSADTLNLSGVRFLYAASSNSRIFVPLKTLTVTGDGQNNTRTDTVIGSPGNDIILGSNGTDYLSSGQGNDIINGGRGRDFINGGFGNDSLTGGSGQDEFIFSGRFGSDIVADFVGNQDTLNLRSFGLTSAQFASAVTINRTSTTTIIDLTSFGGGDITLQAYAPSNAAAIPVLL